jgi:hypothetical protein
MKLDDNWRKGFDLCLPFWIVKIQELAEIENKTLDEDTNIYGKPKHCQNMDSAICQSITTEQTIHSTQGSSRKTSIPWNTFYNRGLSNA